MVQSKFDVDTVLDELDSRKLLLTCGQHKYYGKVPPINGCTDCWKVYYLETLAKAPPSQRGALLAGLEKTIRDAVQLVEQGKFDFRPYKHPHIKIGDN